MESTTSNVELIDKFIENEHKSKRWTMLSVSLFTLLALLVLVLAYYLNTTQQQLNIAQSDLEKAYDSLFSLNSP